MRLRRKLPSGVHCVHPAATFKIGDPAGPHFSRHLVAGLAPPGPDVKSPHPPTPKTSVEGEIPDFGRRSKICGAPAASAAGAHVSEKTFATF